MIPFNSSTHIWSESNLVIFEIPEILNIVMSSPELALSDFTMGYAVRSNVPRFMY